MKSKSYIKFNYHLTDFRLKDILSNRTFLAAVMAQEETPFLAIDYIFCNDKYLLELNKQYLNHDTLTDILTFSLSLPDEPIAAEIYISIDRVRENAEKFNCRFEDELRRVMIHGLLHLCGYNDATEEEKSEMRNKEDQYLSQ